MALVNDDAERMLDQWGLWCRLGRPGPKAYKSIAGVLEEAMVQQQGASGFTEEDEVMEVFDRRVMAVLRGENPDAYEAVYQYYAVGFAEDRHGVRELGRRLKVSKDLASKRLYAAITAVASMVTALAA